MKILTMKTYFFHLLVGAALLVAPGVSAQSAPAKRYAIGTFPSEARFSAAQFNQNLKLNKGQRFTLSIDDKLSFSGDVLSSVEKFGKLSTLTVTSAEWNNAVLTISRISLGDKTYTYKGQIISSDYSEGYSLTRNDDGTYSFTKLDMMSLLQDR